MNWDDLARRFRAALDGFLAFFAGSATGGHEDEPTTEGTAATDPGTGDCDEGDADTEGDVVKPQPDLDGTAPEPSPPSEGNEEPGLVPAEVLAMLDGDLTDPANTIKLMDWLAADGRLPAGRGRGGPPLFKRLHHKGGTFDGHRKWCSKPGRSFPVGGPNYQTAIRLRLFVTLLSEVLREGLLDDARRLESILTVRAAVPPKGGWGTHLYPSENAVVTDTPGAPFQPPEGHERVFRFLGYGDLKAAVWFLGMEEGANLDALSLKENLKCRAASFDQVMDLKTAHSPTLLNAPLRKPSPTWQWMAKLVLGLTGRDHTDPAAANGYVADALGRKGGGTLLAELFPLPSPDAATWPEEYEDWFANRDEYERRIASWRRELLTSALDQSEPQLVVAYGARHWPHYKALFNDVDFRKLDELDVRFRVGRRGATTVVLSPFLGNSQMTHEALGNLILHLRSEGIDLA